MNYREKQLRQQTKNTIAKLQTEWEQEKQVLKQDIVNLENSADIKLLNQAQEKNKEIQQLLDNTVNLLGSSDIKNLTDLKNLLQGQTLKELIANHKQELKESKKQVQSLTNANEKLAKEKDSLVLEKNNHQEQLRAINTLFDPNAKNYKEIDFNGLYSLLEKVAESIPEKKKSWWGK